MVKEIVGTESQLHLQSYPFLNNNPFLSYLKVTITCTVAVLYLGSTCTDVSEIECRRSFSITSPIMFSISNGLFSPYPILPLIKINQSSVDYYS